MSLDEKSLIKIASHNNLTIECIDTGEYRVIAPTMYVTQDGDIQKEFIEYPVYSIEELQSMIMDLVWKMSMTPEQDDLPL